MDSFPVVMQTPHGNFTFKTEREYGRHIAACRHSDQRPYRTMGDFDHMVCMRCWTVEYRLGSQ